MDWSGFNRAIAEMSSMSSPRVSQEEKEWLNKESDKAKYGDNDQKASYFSNMADETQGRLARGAFHTITDVLNQFDLLVTAKSGEMNSRIEANKEKIQQSKSIFNLA
ncbi:MAG: hypothetical protein AB1782_08015 [Cyanobacteriota bacterium]